VLDEMFTKYNFRKLEFSVVVGNPIEKSYDRLIYKYGGRIVGTYKKHTRLMDNKYYDEKLYEIFRDDYIKNRTR
jgi:RimJ/RimL family protein N-acetyltransferase